MAQQIIRSIGSDGKEVLSNVLGKHVGDNLTYKEVDLYGDGTPMSDAKLDSDRVLYIKKDGKYFRNTKFDYEVNVKDFGAVGDGVTDDTVAIQKAIDSIGNRFRKAYSNSTGQNRSVFFGVKTLIFPQGVYKYSSTLFIYSNIVLSGEGNVNGGAILLYTGIGDAIVVNSDFTGSYTDPQAPQLVNVFEFRGLSLRAENASRGIVLGTKIFRWVLFEKGSIGGVKGRAVDMGEAVYFVGVRNFEVTDCDEGIYAGAYCDHFTVDDRSMFHGNRGASLILECPTFHIENTDFEGNTGTTGNIEVRGRLGVPNARNGVIFNNRFGPENGYSNQMPYDIYIYDIEGTNSIMSGCIISGNKHFSEMGALQKIAPIALNGNITNFIIKDNVQSNNYFSQYYVDTVSPQKTGLSTKNVINSIELVNPLVRSCFFGNSTTGLIQVVQNNPTIVKYSIIYEASFSSLSFNQKRIMTGIRLSLSTSRVNYNKVVGIANRDFDITTQTKPIWISGEGSVIDTELDLTGVELGTLVYGNGSSISLNPGTDSLNFIVGLTASSGVNGKVLVSFLNKNIASDSEVSAGTNNAGSVTPPMLKRRLEVAATTSIKGMLELATQTETNAGTDNERAITPLTLNGRLSQGTVPAITTADATDEATAIALTNEIKAKVNEMITKLSTIIFK